MKNFLPANKLLPVTRLTEALMDPSAASNQSLQETDEYVFLDPRAPRNPNAGLGISGVGAPGAGGAGSGRARRMAFSEGVVFVVGAPGTSSTATSRSGRRRRASGLRMAGRRSWTLEDSSRFWRVWARPPHRHLG